jgi:hypothetical protein
VGCFPVGKDDALPRSRATRIVHVFPTDLLLGSLAVQVYPRLSRSGVSKALAGHSDGPRFGWDVSSQYSNKRADTKALTSSSS